MVARSLQRLLRQPPAETNGTEPDVQRRLRRQVRGISRQIAWAQAYIAWLQLSLARVDELTARGWTEHIDGACSACGRCVVSPSDAEGVVGRMAMRCLHGHVIHLHCLVAVEDDDFAACPCCWARGQGPTR